MDEGYVPRWFDLDEVAGLDRRLVKMLDHARGFSKVPYVITSGLRTPEENRAVDGVMYSAHVQGLAVDLACSGSRVRMKILAGALMAGFKRIGLYTRHVHLDIDGSKPLDVCWIGESK